MGMSSKMTRRQLASMLAASSAALRGQVTNPAPPLPANPAEELEAARAQIRQNGERLALVDLPLSTEPAVHFRA